MSRLGRLLAIGLPALWLGLFVLVPFALVAKISLSESAVAQPPYRPTFPASFDLGRWAEALRALGLDSYRTLAEDPLYRDAFAASLGLAALATALVVPVGYAIALAIARSPDRWRPALTAAIVLPFWTSFLLRVYAWISILKGDGWLNEVLLASGLVDAPVALLNTNTAVIIGLVYVYLPFMILPVLASLDRQDAALLEAAADLGASPLGRFWSVTVPLSWPGIAAGALLCFIPMVGEFVVPELLGGSDTLLVGRTLWSEFFTNRDWPLAAAIAVAMLVILAGPTVLLREIEARRAEAAR